MPIKTKPNKDGFESDGYPTITKLGKSVSAWMPDGKAIRKHFKEVSLRVHAGYRISRGYKLLTVWFFCHNRALGVTSTVKPNGDLNRRQRYDLFAERLAPLHIKLLPYKPTKEELKLRSK
jgi:hypothetical protein